MAIETSLLIYAAVGIALSLFALYQFRRKRPAPLQRAAQARERGSYDEAKQWGNVALELATDDFARAQAFRELAHIHRLAGSHQESIEFSRRDLVLRRQLLPAGDSDLAACYGNLAHSLLCIGKLDEAEQNLRQGLDIINSAPEADLQLKAHLLSRLGYVCAGVGKMDESTRVAAESVELTRQEFGDVHDRTAEALLNQGLAATIAGQYAISLQALQAAYSRFVQLYGANHLSSLMTRKSEGSLISDWSWLKQDAAGLAHADRILDSTSKALIEHLGPASQYAGDCLTSLARVRSWQQRHTEAVDLATRAVRSFELSVGAESPAMIHAHLHLAEALAHAGRTTEAHELAQKALAATQQAYGAEHFECGCPLETLGRTAAAAGQFAAAEDYFWRCLSFREPLGVKHPLRAFALRELAKVLQSLGRPEEAAACRREDAAIVAAAC